MKGRSVQAMCALGLSGALLGCAQTAAPQGVGPLTFPEASSAVQVSSARFFAIDPAATLNNSAMRNCRFGRTTKIPLVASLVELSATTLKVSGQPLAALSDGRLEPDHLAALRSHLQPMASVSRSLAESACHPWRSGPEDASMMPALLVAAESSAPASSLDGVIDAAWSSGFEEVALWSRSAGAGGAAQGAGTVLTPAGGTVADVVSEIDRVRLSGDPCVLVSPPADRQEAGSAGPGNPTSSVLTGSIPVLPIARTGDRRLVSGEVCGVPPEQTLGGTPEQDRVHHDE